MAAKATCLAAILTGALIGSCLPAGDDGEQANALAAADDAEDKDLPPGAPAQITISQFSPAFFGRWAMLPAECEPGRSDAKGLITIQGSLVKFYESIATLRGGTRLSTMEMQGNFEFVGEGEKWQQPMRFALSPDRQALTRTDLGDGKSYHYLRCPDPLSTSAG